MRISLRKKSQRVRDILHETFSAARRSRSPVAPRFNSRRANALGVGPPQAARFQVSSAEYPFPPFILDFYCPQARLAVELDGAHHVEARDARRDEFLAAKNVIVFRIENHVLREDPETVLVALKTLIAARVRRVAVSKSTRPSTSSAMKRGGRRVTQVVSATVETSASSWAAVLPPPTTSTRRPANGDGSRYWAACSCAPPKSRIPGTAGQKGRSQVPVAESTARAR